MLDALYDLLREAEYDYLLSSDQRYAAGLRNGLRQALLIVAREAPTWTPKNPALWGGNHD